MKPSFSEKMRFNEMVVGKIRFLREQDGLPEREFKQAVIPVLTGIVQRAYLVYVEYLDSGMNGVALCLTSIEQEELLAKRVAEIFAPMFGSDQHLDIMFLKEEEEKILAHVCHPFFVGE